MPPLSHLTLYKRLMKKFTNEDSPFVHLCKDSRNPPEIFGRVSTLGRIRGRSLVDDPLSVSEQLTGSKELLAAPTPKLLVEFVNSLTAGKFSNFLVWLLYFDIVQMPESPSRWYRYIDSMELRGWIALGTFFSLNPKYGLDLVVFDSICDRLNLSKNLVKEMIIQVADPKKMEYTRMSRVFQDAAEGN